MLTAAETAEITLRSLLIAGVATAVVTPPSLALAWVLARRDFPGRSVVQGVLVLPLVVPPVAVGVALLLALSPQRPWAGAVQALLGGNPLFTWRAAAIAAAVMGAPLLVRTAEAAFAAVPRRLEQAAESLGSSAWRVFWTVSLPLAGRGVAYGVLLCLLRAMSEFGATTLVAGNIPGETETLSLAIHARVRAGDDAEAALLAGVSVVLAFTATVLAERFCRRPAISPAGR